MNRLLIVSNRLPISISRKNGDLRLQRSVGGLATGVGSFYKSYESLWVGWPGINVQRKHEEEKDRIVDVLRKEQCHPVFLSPYDIKHYYDGFCNNTLWPLLHYFNLSADYDPKTWQVYQRVNEKFCDAVMEVARPDDIIWVHDYHLMLLPQMLRERLPDAEIGYFHHIPFPSFEIFRNLPWGKEILSGLLGADLIGFHTYGYVRHFLSSVRRLLGYEHTFGEVRTGTRMVRTDLFPMGIDYHRFADSAGSPPSRRRSPGSGISTGNGRSSSRLTAWITRRGYRSGSRPSTRSSKRSRITRERSPSSSLRSRPGSASAVTRC
jgi:Trehalose-6-phosphate synthase